MVIERAAFLSKLRDGGQADAPAAGKGLEWLEEAHELAVGSELSRGAMSRARTLQTATRARLEYVACGLGGGCAKRDAMRRSLKHMLNRGLARAFAWWNGVRPTRGPAAAASGLLVVVESQAVAAWMSWLDAQQESIGHTRAMRWPGGDLLHQSHLVRGWHALLQEWAEMAELRASSSAAARCIGSSSAPSARRSCSTSRADE